MKNTKTFGLIAAPIAIAASLYFNPSTPEVEIAPEVETAPEPRIVSPHEMAGANLTQFIAYKESYKMVNGQLVPYFPGIAMIEFYDNGFYRITKNGEMYLTDTFPAEEVKDLEILYPR